MDLLTNQPQLLQEWINTATEDSDGLLYGLMSAWPYDLASSSIAGAAAPGRGYLVSYPKEIFQQCTSATHAEAVQPKVQRQGVP